jgi:hypothetical protein
MALDQGGGIAADEGNSLFLSNYTATVGQFLLASTVAVLAKLEVAELATDEKRVKKKEK